MTKIIIAVVAALVLWVVYVFNSLIRRRNLVRNGWADIDVQLKRRYDLIPNLVEVVKGYAGHEKSLFEKVTSARASAMTAEHPAEKEKAEQTLSSALKTLFAVAENYPDLKANANFLDLQRELADTENKIQASRRFYNTTVRDLNTKAHSFPSTLIAQMFNFHEEKFFEVASAQEREVVNVKF